MHAAHQAPPFCRLRKECDGGPQRHFMSFRRRSSLGRSFANRGSVLVNVFETTVSQMRLTDRRTLHPANGLTSRAKTFTVISNPHIAVRSETPVTGQRLFQIGSAPSFVVIVPIVVLHPAGQGRPDRLSSKAALAFAAWASR
jgi:hypothetical protein